MRNNIMFRESITREEVDNLSLGYFNGDIVLVDKPEQVKEAAGILASQKLVGFDTETKPSFKKGVVNKAALLQLSTENQAFLFRINKLGLPYEIRRILSSPNIKKAGVAIHDDIKGLQDLKNFTPHGFVELQDFAKEFGIKNFSLKKLSAIVLGFRISKSQQLSNWEATTLSSAQEIYAATDAWVALKIYEKFFNE
jgi:ribonuclease D